jgi:hypothetical protein
LFVHFQHGSLNGSNDGYYYLSAVEQFGSSDDIKAALNISEKIKLSKEVLNKFNIKKIALA